MSQNENEPIDYEVIDSQKVKMREFWSNMTVIVIILVLVYVYDCWVQEREKTVAWKYIQAHDIRVQRREIEIICKNPIIVCGPDAGD